MQIKLSRQEITEILQDHFDDLGMEVLIEYVFCKEDRPTTILDWIEVQVIPKEEILREVSK